MLSVYMAGGNHIYQEIWTAAVGERLSCIRKSESYHDPFAVVVVNSGVTVGHVTRKISSVQCS